MRPLPVNLRAEWDFYNTDGFQYMNLHFAKNPVVVTFSVLYCASAAEISLLSVHLVCSIYFTEKA